MCGIFFYSEGSSELAENACKLLHRRGPDKSIKDIQPDYTAVFQRLAINDLHESGDQPMYSKDKKVFMMCNGEIFNFKNLIHEYNLVCQSKSDCEVILRAYLNPNIDFLNFIKDINGDFAMVIVDLKEKIVLCARDRIGVRPLFFGLTNSFEFAIASEAKVLQFCEQSISQIKPGILLSFDLNDKPSRVSRNYYDIYSFLEYPFFHRNSHLLRTLLYKAVEVRLMSERPIGCLLSGGLDSSIITSILCDILGPQNVRTYSIGMKGSLDLHYAQKVATYLNTNHTEILFTPEEGLEAIPEVIYNLESYDITTVRASVGMYLLGKYISQNTEDKVIFSGEGSDEIMCGYLYFHNAPSGQEAHAESIRLISELYKFDCLRADRCISSHGLELRVPFLDKNVVNFCTTLSGDLKVPSEQIEKRILREQFKDLLPDEVVWRRKDGFSDGVSAATKSWYEYIKEHVETLVKDDEIGDAISKEAYYYKKIYNSYYPFYKNPIDHYWMPKWTKLQDPSNPSGRILPIFNV